MSKQSEAKDFSFLEIGMDMATGKDEAVMCVWERKYNCTKMVGMFSGWKAELLYKILTHEIQFEPMMLEGEEP